MRLRSALGPLVWPVVAALALATALVGVALLAARTLRERDEAVRLGVLSGFAHAIESELREAGPDGAKAIVERFCADRSGSLSGIRLGGPRGTVAECGVIGDGAVEYSVALGHGWRGVVGGPGTGPGMGAGRGGPPAARLILSPSGELAHERGLAAVLIGGATLVGVALVVFAVLGVMGLAQRQRLMSAEAERSRLEALASAGAGLAHRIRNPLAAIKGTAQLLLELPEGPVRTRADRMLDASRRIEELVDRLLAFARPAEARPERFDVTELLRRVVERSEPETRVAGAGDIEVRADREQIESIVEELLANARALDPNGTLEVCVERRGREAVVEVRDRGPGLALSPEQAFQPYVTTRSDGTGLGLAIVRALARANGGEVTLFDREGGGCVAELRLPLAGG